MARATKDTKSRERRIRRSAPATRKKTRSTQDWLWSKVFPIFGDHGCSVRGCPFSRPGGCDDILCCALNVSDALIRAGYILPGAANINCCDHHRVRNADGMARVCNEQNGGNPDVRGWENRPNWKGFVYFGGALRLEFAAHVLATGHIDLWDGRKAVHTQYPGADTVWFWRLGG